jgi:ligand-binding sensor domain-containing protein
LSNKKPAVTVIASRYERIKGMIFGILEAYDGTIWFGALDGVYRYDGNTITDSKGKVVPE